MQYSPAINTAHTAEFISNGFQSAFSSFALAAENPENKGLSLDAEAVSVLFQEQEGLFNDRAILPGVKAAGISAGQEAGAAGSYTLAPDVVAKIAVIQETYRSA